MPKEDRSFSEASTVLRQSLVRHRAHRHMQSNMTKFLTFRGRPRYPTYPQKKKSPSECLKRPVGQEANLNNLWGGTEQTPRNSPSNTIAHILPPYQFHDFSLAPGPEQCPALATPTFQICTPHRVSVGQRVIETASSAINTCKRICPFRGATPLSDKAFAYTASHPSNRKA
eukprot:3619001-Amphidinium_carterae.3